MTQPYAWAKRRLVSQRFRWSLLALTASLLLVWATGAIGQSQRKTGEGLDDPRCMQQFANACVDWSNATGLAQGTGLPPAWARGDAQRQQAALRAAIIDASRNMLELVKGVNLTSNSTLENAMLVNDTITSTVEGRLFGLRPVGEPRIERDPQGQIVAVTVWIEARLTEMLPEETLLTPPRPNPEAPLPRLAPDGPTTRQTGINVRRDYTGLIVDARGLNLAPALAPRILGPDGNEVYGSHMVSRQFLLEQGMAGYVKDTTSALSTARSNPRVGESPLVIVAQAVAGTQQADVVVDAATARALNALNLSQPFLRETRVIIVLD